MSTGKKIKIALDEAIQYYNEKNPEKKPLNQTGLSEKLNVDVHKQVFTQWKNKVPKSIIILKEVSEVTGYPLRKLIIEDEQKS